MLDYAEKADRSCLNGGGSERPLVTKASVTWIVGSRPMGRIPTGNRPQPRDFTDRPATALRIVRKPSLTRRPNGPDEDRPDRAARLPGLEHKGGISLRNRQGATGLLLTITALQHLRDGPRDCPAVARRGRGSGMGMSMRGGSLRRPGASGACRPAAAGPAFLCELISIKARPLRSA